MNTPAKVTIFIIVVALVIFGIVFLKVGGKDGLKDYAVKVESDVPTSTDEAVGDESPNERADLPSTTKHTIANIESHGTESDCWTAINGKVYDVIAFFGKHPGGDRNLLRVCGKDATAIFSKQHGSQTKPNSKLDDFIIGELVK